MGRHSRSQDRGSRAESNAYIERHSAWGERNEQIGRRIKATERYRFRHSRFALLGAEPAAGR